MDGREISRAVTVSPSTGAIEGEQGGEAGGTGLMGQSVDDLGAVVVRRRWNEAVFTRLSAQRDRERQERHELRERHGRQRETILQQRTAAAPLDPPDHEARMGGGELTSDKTPQAEVAVQTEQGPPASEAAEEKTSPTTPTAPVETGPDAPGAAMRPQIVIPPGAPGEHEGPSTARLTEPPAGGLRRQHADTEETSDDDAGGRRARRRRTAQRPIDGLSTWNQEQLRLLQHAERRRWASLLSMSVEALQEDLAPTDMARLERTADAFSFMVYRYRAYLPSGQRRQFMRHRRAINAFSEVRRSACRPEELVARMMRRADDPYGTAEARYADSSIANTPTNVGTWSWTGHDVLHNPDA